jgi:hypothetical protein
VWCVFLVVSGEESSRAGRGLKLILVCDPVVGKWENESCQLDGGGAGRTWVLEGGSLAL